MINLIIDYSHSDAPIIEKKLKEIGCKTIIISTPDGKKLTAFNVNENFIKESPFFADRNFTIKPQNTHLLTDRELTKKDTIIELPYNIKIGSNSFTVIAGPCSIESEEQLDIIAKKVKEMGAHVLRGGSFKPRTSPYAFQGLGEKALKILKKVGEKYKLPVITEVMDSENIALVEEYSDIIQVGARNCQNYSLLKKLGKTKKPILLKRGMMTTIKEFLLSAEYILCGGNMNVILCERGIRTFETETRNTLDLSAIPILKEKTHLPVIVDPSHATGKAKLVYPMTLASLACGADGAMIEVHNEPENALSDGEQSITPEEFAQIMNKIKKLADEFNREI